MICAQQLYVRKSLKLKLFTENLDSSAFIFMVLSSVF